MTEQEQTKVLLKGTAILAAAALISKVLGVVYRIPYQNITGDLGLYVFQQVYPLYSLLLIVATAGFPIAVSKLVAERIALGDHNGAKRVFRVSAVALSLTGLVTFLAMYAGAPYIASWMEDDGLILPLRSVSFALLIVPFMAAIRGYFQGHQNMVPTAISQVIEQIIRVITIIALSYWFMANQYDEYYAGAGAVFGAFTGAAAALIFLLLLWRRVQAKHNKQPQKATPTTEESHGDEDQSSAPETFTQETVVQLIKRILYLAIPICLGAMVLPLFQIVDAMTVVKVLNHTGIEPIDSRNLKGVFDRGQPLVQFAAFFATALSLALVPSISEAYAKNNHKLIAVRSEMALRLTLFLGLAASFGLAVLAGPVNIMLYKTGDGTITLAVLAFTTMFSTLGIASGAVLQGLGRVILPARNLLAGVVVKTILNVALIPIWGITGAALATVLAYGVATILNLVALHKITKLQLSFKVFFAKPFTAVIAMAVLVWLTMEGLLFALSGVITHERIYFAIVALSSVAVGVVTYALGLLKFGAVTKEELQSVPKVNRFVPLLDKFKFFKS
ncbi:putative polysaccharide biosynthesis protein [Caldalkalibacillus salinus]|uniref:putative polysaccharide biosynthesis protein n=1 Tax=Caldalkalibacillus salinus TaxID=2803787 RepID=UPI001924D806|nr:polysaccharide biosynthesis protein [Caldalkalibacillus salinus]